MKKSTFIISMILLLSLFVGCNSEASTKDKINDKKGIVKEEEENEEGINSVIVATSPGYAPFEFMEEDELVGYEVDIWNEFEKRTGIEVVWEFADFSGLLGLLDSKKADIIAAQFSPTEERKEKYDFSKPINYYNQVIVITPTNEEITSIDDLKNKKVGMGSGADAENVLREIHGEDVEIEFYTSATLENQYKDLEFGRIDAVIAQDIQIFEAMNENDSLDLKILEEPINSSPATFVFNKGTDELQKVINDFIQELREDGTLTELSEKWVGADISLER